MPIAAFLRNFLRNRRRAARHKVLFLTCEISDLPPAQAAAPPASSVLAAMVQNVSETGLGLLVPAASFNADRFSPAAGHELLFRVTLPVGVVTVAGRVVHHIPTIIPELPTADYIYLGVQLEPERGPDHKQFVAFTRWMH